jgi:predicted dinucleotide-binding enzyme
LAPGANVVRMFNTNGARKMADADYGGRKVTMLYTGDEAGASRIAAGLTAEVDFEPI